VRYESIREAAIALGVNNKMPCRSDIISKGNESVEIKFPGDMVELMPRERMIIPKRRLVKAGKGYKLKRIIPGEAISESKSDDE